MKKEVDLNAMLNTDQISETTDVAELGRKAKSATAETTTPVETNAEVTPPASQPEAVVEGVVAPGTFITLFNYLANFKTKITNASITNIGGFSRVPAGKYMLFCTNEQTNAELILFERPDSLWVDQSIIPDSIKIESSGIIIKNNSCRLYVGKNNITKITILLDKVTDVSVYSRSKDALSVRVKAEEVAVSITPAVDVVKLHVKKVSPRLFNAVKDMTTIEEIKAGIIDFMQRVYDLNHLIKIEKELLMTLSL